MVAKLSSMIQSIWDTSPLSILTRENPIRFLGMELTVRGREQGIYIYIYICLSQQGYVEEMLKSWYRREGQDPDQQGASGLRSP